MILVLRWASPGTHYIKHYSHHHHDEHPSFTARHPMRNDFPLIRSFSKEIPRCFFSHRNDQSAKPWVRSETSLFCLEWWLGLPGSFLDRSYRKIVGEIMGPKRNLTQGAQIPKKQPIIYPPYSYEAPCNEHAEQIWFGHSKSFNGSLSCAGEGATMGHQTHNLWSISSPFPQKALVDKSSH